METEMIERPPRPACPERLHPPLLSTCGSALPVHLPVLSIWEEARGKSQLLWQQTPLLDECWVGSTVMGTTLEAGAKSELLWPDICLWDTML